MTTPEFKYIVVKGKHDTLWFAKASDALAIMRTGDLLYEVSHCKLFPQTEAFPGARPPAVYLTDQDRTRIKEAVTQHRLDYNNSYNQMSSLSSPTQPKMTHDQLVGVLISAFKKVNEAT